MPDLVNNDTWSKRFNSWGAMFVTVAVFVLLFLGMLIAARMTEPPAAFTNLMETVKALAMVCAGYWVGSSNSSQKKDEALSAALATSASQVTTTTTAETGAGNVKTVTEPKEPKTQFEEGIER